MCDRNKMVLVPAKLTAENGAKAALMGEFRENVIMGCADCDGEGFIDGEPCEDCGGVGEYATSFPVSWTTIKAIWEKAVSVVGEPYDPELNREQLDFKQTTGFDLPVILKEK